MQSVSQVEMKEWKFLAREKTPAKRQRQENPSAWLHHDGHEEKMEDRTKNILLEAIFGEAEN